MAQDDPCDLNNNGFPDVGDLGALLGLVGGADGLDTLPIYDPMLDCDRDSLHLTISDLVGLAHRLVRGPAWGQGRQWWLPLDSLYIPEHEVSPGDDIDIPVYMKTEHRLTNVQIALRYDPRLLQIDDFIISDSIPDRYDPRIYLFEGGISVVIGLAAYDDEVFYSGHLGDLRTHVLVGSLEEQETVIEFFDDPRQALYTGLASSNYIFDSPAIELLFTHPVTVDGIIGIIDRGHWDAGEVNGSLFALEAYPNPFNNSVSIAFELPLESDVRIDVFDLLGREVVHLYEGNLPSGINRLIWRADDLPSGVYFCRLESEGKMITKRITLLR
jgi:hypothetical protein